VPSTFTKDPDAVLDYAFNWSDWLDSTQEETIESYVVTADAGLTVDSHAESDGKVTVWLSGGTVAATYYKVACKVTTSLGRTDERSMRFKVIER